ncbi:BnaC03g41120D [Brassica napus]|uniref:BnaC03g41120D protein n=1 Tax=Brassica napus TaxID=3708 RepID=A0A078GD27_BRANA|nr:BnaC03g41120D [Brassica napus]
MASESSRIGLFMNAEVTTSGRPVLRRNEVECFLLSSVDLDSEDDPPRFTSLRWKKLSIIGDLQLQQQLKVELMVSSRWCCGVGYISFRSVVLKVEKTNIPHGSATIGSVASSSKVVYPDTAQMIVYDPTKKSEFSSSVKPMAASASNTFQSNVTATATHVSANTFDEIPKTTPPALLAFLANLPHVDGKFLNLVPSD